MASENVFKYIDQQQKHLYLIRTIYRKSITNFGIKTDNRASQLEWATNAENVLHAYRTGLEVAKKGKEHHKSVGVKQFDLEGNFIKEWDCITDIERELKICRQNVWQTCNRKRKTAGGYIWRYKDYKQSFFYLYITLKVLVGAIPTNVKGESIMRKFVVKPDLTLYSGVLVNKDTKLEYKNENVTQKLENLKLEMTTYTKENNYEVTSNLTFHLSEGDILLFDSEVGYQMPKIPMSTLKDALGDLEAIQSFDSVKEG